MVRPWAKLYAPQVNPEVNPEAFPSLAAMLEKTCSDFTQKNAIHCMGGSLTFGQLNSLANQFANYLQNSLGLKKGDRIAIMLPNISQFPIVFFAAQKIGLICVNTNPQYTEREMRHQFADSGAKAIVILDLFADKLQSVLADTKIENIVITSIGDQLPLIKRIVIGTLLRIKRMIPSHSLKFTPFKEALARGANGKHSPVKVEHSDVAILQYTGGTTGSPKGAMLTQRNIISNVLQIQEWSKALNITSEEVALTALPLYHIFALTVNFLSFLTLGAETILVPKPIPISNTSKLFKKYRITLMTGVNTLYNALNHCPIFNEAAPKSIKIALAGGMALQQSVSDKFQSITGCKVTEGFGMTESSPVTHCNPIHVPTPAGSIGLPLPSTDAKIVDEDGDEMPIGEVGELIVRGPQIMKGYWQKSEETANTVKDGWLWTGDIARQDEKGFFYIVDRKKDMILVSGFNVYPNEIEEVLASHPKILESAVVGVTDEDTGEAVKAFIVRKDNSLTEAEVTAYCKTQLTGYKRPKHIEFKKELPKTNIGKILRRELKQPKAS